MKPGSPEVRKSANNIYKIPASGSGQPTQVTKHLDGHVFWPSMSSDGKVIVYEDNFGIWKLDVASGRSTEIKLDIATDEKDNEAEIETVTNQVDNFDISPSGRRAVISVRGQILTIATDRGDITRVNPDKMASRSDSPKWSADGKFVAFISDKSGRDEVWISDPEGRTPKKITDLDNEKGALVWTPDSKMLLYTAADKKLYSYAVADAKTSVISSSDVARIGSVAVSPDSKWVSFSKQDRTLRSHVYIAPIDAAAHARNRAPPLRRQHDVFRDQRGLDGRRPLHRLHVGRGRERRHRLAGQSGDDDGAVGDVAGGPGSRPDEPRHRQ